MEDTEGAMSTRMQREIRCSSYEVQSMLTDSHRSDCGDTSDA